LTSLKSTLLEPFFAAHFPEEAKNVWRINELRKDIFHAKVAIEDAKFEGHSISEEKTVENLFLAAQSISSKFSKFEEMVDAPHAYADRWRKRLSELGEPLR
jgi:hypothetical protein